MYKCFVCDNMILPEDSKIMFPLEKPYLNLYIHKSCFLSIKDNLYEYLPKNIEKMYNIYVETVKNSKK